MVKSIIEGEIKETDLEITQMLGVTDKNFRTPIRKMLKDVK